MQFVNGMAQLPHVIPFGILVILDFFLVAMSAGLILISAFSLSIQNEKVKALVKPAGYLALATVIAGPVALLADLGHPLRFFNLFLYFNPRSAMSWGSYILVLYTLGVLIYLWQLHQNSRITKRWGFIAAFLGICLASYTGMLLAEAHTRFFWNSALTPILFIFSGWVAAWGLLALSSHWFAEKTRLKGANLDSVFRFSLMGLLSVEMIFVAVQLLVLAASGVQGLAQLKILFSMHPITFVGIQIILGMIVPLVLLSESKKPNMIPFAGLLSMIGVFFIRYNMVIAGQELPQTGTIMAYPENSMLMWGVFVIALVLAGLCIAFIPTIFESILKKRVSHHVS